MLTFEINPDGQVVEISCDQSGLNRFIEQLSRLTASVGHIHLKTPSWAGNELGEKVRTEQNILVHHVIVTLVGEKHD